jgi:hypothetical protein
MVVMVVVMMMPDNDALVMMMVVMVMADLNRDLGYLFTGRRSLGEPCVIGLQRGCGIRHRSEQVAVTRRRRQSGFLAGGRLGARHGRQGSRRSQKTG